MAANGAPVLVKRGTPVDMGRLFPDGRRILGDGKTLEGLLVGILMGAGVGAIYSSALGNPWFLPYSLTSAAGALLGDMGGAFIKRRLGLPRGAPAPVLDQMGFYLAANGSIKALSLDRIVGMEISLEIFLSGALLVAILHVATNWGAHRLGLKSVPY